MFLNLNIIWGRSAGEKQYDIGDQVMIILRWMIRALDLRFRSLAETRGLSNRRAEVVVNKHQTMWNIPR